jgi:hypothetical protein
MNIGISIIEVEAEPVQAPQQEDENATEYAERIHAAKGCNFLHVTVQLDGKQVQFESPYFLRSLERQKWNILDQALKHAKKAVVAASRHQEKPITLVEEPSRIITKGFPRIMREHSGPNAGQR